MWSGAKWSASCVGVPSRSPEVPVRLAPGKVCQESERPEASQRGAHGVSGVWSKDAGQHLLAEFGEDRLLGSEVGLPGRRVPDLDPGVRADDRAFTAQARVVA
jgi:hypothetical protein